MHAHEHASLSPHERRSLPPHLPFRPLLIGGMVALLFALLLSLATDLGIRRFWFAYLASFAFYLSISLGALFFVLIQFLVRAGWSVAVRRPAEIIAANLPLMAVLFLPILGVVLSGKGTLYHWAQPLEKAAVVHGGGREVPPAAPANHHQSSADAGHTAETATNAHDHSKADPLMVAKRPYLNIPFFTLRWILFFAVWAGLGYTFWNASVGQDGHGKPLTTLRLQTVSGVSVLAFGVTVTFGAFDLLMSLDAHWYSTIFGVYFFAGCMVGFFATMAVTLRTLQWSGYLTESVRDDHFHDIGKFLFGFIFFWGYIGFSQYMLIWYGNIPEETAWMLRRGVAVQAPNAWSPVIILLLFGHFIIPFLGLLSRHVKRHPAGLVFWASWMLVMHWVDLYWLTMPELTTRSRPLLIEIICLAGMGAVFLAGLARRAGGRNLVAVRDPRLHESLNFQNI